MKMRNLRQAVALAGLTAGVALLAGAGSAQAAPSAPGGGSFPGSFLIPGTNTSIRIYGTIAMKVEDDFGSPHVSDTGPSGAGATAFTIGGIPLEGPGAAGGNSTNNQEHALHGGLRWSAKYSGIFFETRTPTDLGEMKTVIFTQFAKMTNQGTYLSNSSTSTNEPQVSAGNNEIPRLMFAYGTLGPWLAGQYSSAWADPIMTNPIGDSASQVGPLQTANIRRPQIRYTYLMGNGMSASVSIEANTFDNKICVGAASTVTGNCVGALIPLHEDSTDVGGVTNYPSINAGVAWDQPWGHVMARVGFAENDIRNERNLVIGNTLNSIGTTSGTNKKIAGYAIEGGVMLNTWGHDQWRGLVVYSHAAETFLTDMVGNGNAYLNPVTGSLDAIKELAFNTSYVHRFNPNWSASADFGIGFFSKPDNAAGLSNTANGASGALLASLEKRHLNSALQIAYSPVPGKVRIPLEWDHYDRWVQASNTWGDSNRYSISFIFFW